ncbi:hypothetical protein BXY82_0240 [Gelidibacter sediminis]|uniref:Na(+)-translocating NADH-quinone reductase subunit F n=1 Tax=Gelidibacter sediminis TaxID=1608710 RepID=A0A4R7Q7W6_9FLAO|nr:Na(+)-translocating NADH-quinone reductase subunit F [Gelidibacter sediminis]TDU42841.1 hypothetical protein BXY82_0240 [Gelidibacter sediminis]
MNTSHRLEQALKKLYTAFYNDTLHPECCQQCAVGNILDQTDAWKHFSDRHGSLQLNYVGLVHQNLGRKFNGYTPSELLQIEAIFLKACGYSLPLMSTSKRIEDPQDKDLLFVALLETIKFLCELDGIPDILEHKPMLRNHKDQQISVLENQPID